MNKYAKKNCIHVPEGLINEICLQRVTEANGTVADLKVALGLCFLTAVFSKLVLLCDKVYMVKRANEEQHHQP